MATVAPYKQQLVVTLSLLEMKMKIAELDSIISEKVDVRHIRHKSVRFGALHSEDHVKQVDMI